jgi:8-oxo-dGTP pyrophosphatase MutT (NUDIX family)
MKERIRASTVVVADGQLLTVLLEDPHTRITRHFVPGGAVEPGETPADAAARETLEETGITVTLLPHPPLVARYPFVWNDRTYDCTTSFFAATCEKPLKTPIVDDAAYNKGVAWIPLSQVEAMMNFDRHICAAIQSVIRSVFAGA